MDRHERQVGVVADLDFDQVSPRLYQGGKTDPDRSYGPFTMIVLCAEECQPKLPRFRGRVLRPAFDDTARPTERELARARAAALEVAKEITRGGRVLVTCAAGLNRSGLVVGLALNHVTKLTADQIITRIRAARGEHALCNPTFARIVTDGNRHNGGPI